MAQEGWTVDAEEQMLCTNNCGFLGNPATMNLCSKCYEESIAKQPNSYNNNNNNNNNNKLKTLEETAKELSGKSSEEVVATRKESIVEDDAVLETSSAEEQSKSLSPLLQKKQPSPEVPIRCFSCKKRIGLTGIKCRCGSTFCALHRYSDRHNCPFDYRTSARAIIAKSNPLVKAKKIQKL